MTARAPQVTRPRADAARPARSRGRGLLRAAFVAAALALALGPAQAAKRPDFPAPTGAKVKAMGNSVTTHGLTMTVREFTTKDSVEDVRRFYAREWPPERDHPGMLETDAATPWTVLTRVDNGYLLTVQMQPGRAGGTRGYLAISKVPDPERPIEREKMPPALAGTRLISSNRSEDDGQSGEVYLMTNDSSVASNVSFYRNLYAGWRKDMDRAVAPERMYALSFSRGSKRVNLTVIDVEGRAQIALNIITRSLL